jgi:hypothetical protein
MVFTPQTSLDRVNLLKNDMVLIIVSVAPGRNKTGQYFDLKCTDGKTYRSFGKYIMEDLKKLVEENTDFKQGFACKIVGHVAESGNAYFTLETPSEDELAAALKANPIK